jgi:hypothetical protein
MSKISFVPILFTDRSKVGDYRYPASMLLHAATGARVEHDIEATASTGAGRYTAPDVGGYSHILVTATDAVIIAWGPDAAAAVDAAPDGTNMIGVTDLMAGGQMPLAIQPTWTVSWMARPA